MKVFSSKKRSINEKILLRLSIDCIWVGAVGQPWRGQWGSRGGGGSGCRRLVNHWFKSNIFCLLTLIQHAQHNINNLFFIENIRYFRAWMKYDLSLFVVKNLCYIFMLMHSLYPGMVYVLTGKPCGHLVPFR